jgi:TatA/E family protein of Tat protein translocase
MFGIGMQELVVILVIALLVFGPRRLPEFARSLGRGIAELRRASSDLRQTLVEASEEPRIEKPGSEAPASPPAKSEAEPAPAQPPETPGPRPPETPGG